MHILSLGYQCAQLTQIALAGRSGIQKKKTRSYSPTFPYRVLSAQLVSSQGHGDKEKHPNTRHLPIIDSRTNPSAVMLLLLAAVAAKLLLLLRCCCCCQVAAAVAKLVLLQSNCLGTVTWI